MSAPSDHTCRVRVDLSGRIVIPAELRSHYGIGLGDELIVTAGANALEVRTFRQIVKDAQAAFAPYKVEGQDVVEELLADRRAEAARDHDQ